MIDNLPPLPALPPHEVEEWSESFITLRGEGWKKETVEKYAVDYARAALAQAQSCVPAVDGLRLTRFLTDVVTAAGLLSHGNQSKAVAERVSDEAFAIRSMLAASPQPQPVQPSERGHVGNSAFESWFSSYSPAGKGDKQRARDAYAAGMGELAQVVQAKPEQAAQPRHSCDDPLCAVCGDPWAPQPKD